MALFSKKMIIPFGAANPMLATIGFMITVGILLSEGIDLGKKGYAAYKKHQEKKAEMVEVPPTVAAKAPVA
jgi:hypothetical protein